MKPYPVHPTRLVKTCEACPAQWEGEIESGWAIYIRYRHGWLTVGIGPTLGEAILPAASKGLGEEIYCARVGATHDGYMDDDEMWGLLVPGVIVPTLGCAAEMASGGRA